MLIPISDKQRITHEIDGVAYHFKPPVGDTEILILEMIDPGETSLKDYYDRAEKEVKESLKGKKIPGKKERQKMIQDKVLEIHRQEHGNDWKKEFHKIDKLIDETLTGWTSDNKDVPAFPEDGRPSKMMVIELKSKLFEWYHNQLNIREDEAKN